MGRVLQKEFQSPDKPLYLQFEWGLHWDKMGIQKIFFPFYENFLCKIYSVLADASCIYIITKTLVCSKKFVGTLSLLSVAGI